MSASAVNGLFFFFGNCPPQLFPNQKPLKERKKEKKTKKHTGK